MEENEMSLEEFLKDIEDEQQQIEEMCNDPEAVELLNLHYIEMMSEAGCLVEVDELDDSRFIVHELTGDWTYDKNGAEFILRDWRYM